MAILDFLMVFPPVVAVAIFSIIIGIIINFFYKVLVNQNDARQIKSRVKEINEQAKAARKAGDTKKSSELMSEAMRENSKMMRFTMKPMLVSMVIVIIMLPLIAQLYGDSVVNVADNGIGILKVWDKTYSFERSGSTIKINDFQCATPCTAKLDGNTWKITLQEPSVKFARIIAMTPIALPYFGSAFGWLGWYIICSIPIMIIIRKLMKIAM